MPLKRCLREAARPFFLEGMWPEVPACPCRHSELRRPASGDEPRVHGTPSQQPQHTERSSSQRDRVATLGPHPNTPGSSPGLKTVD